jgi:poly(hydroxyalkanoate) depolymerase family esterase
MNPTFQELMRDAARLTRSGSLLQATAAIQRALGCAGLAPTAPMDAPNDHACVIDAPVIEWAERRDLRPTVAPGTAGRLGPQPAAQGEFRAGSHTHGALTRAYKLFVPPGAAGRSLPLVVMLHGCTQDPDDFAAGTGMNALACEQGFYVLYPAQTRDANPSRCWNWFKHSHHTRQRGETAVIGSMTQAVVQAQGIDADRVYIAGLSAGGAMAALVAAAYPDTFAAVGVHSGLPPAAARSLPEGLAAMREGSGGPSMPAGLHARMRSPPGAGSPAELPVPVIVFHGDRDQTVHPRNGEQVVAAALRSRVHSSVASDGGPGIERGVSPGGRHYTRSTHRSASGRSMAEHWVLHGAGHAWSGGLAAGSYTDASGPDATREMLRFFLEQTRPAAAAQG